MSASSTTLVPTTTVSATAAAHTPLLPAGGLNERYEDSPCCTVPKTITSTSMVLSTVALGVGFIPGVPIAVAVAGGASLGATVIEATNSYFAKDQELRRQISRFEGLLQGFGVQVTLLGKNEQDVQKLVEEMGKLFQAQKASLAAFQRREGQADEEAEETAQTRLEEAVKTNQQMSEVLGQVCGAVDKMNALAAAKALISQGAASTQTQLQDVVRQLSGMGGSIVNQLASMRRATGVFQAIQEGLSVAEASFNSHLGKIAEQAASLQETTRGLQEQVASLRAIEQTASKRSSEAEERFKKAQEASSSLLAQLRELQETQQAKIAQLEGKVKLLEKALHIASNQDGELLKKWLLAAQTELKA